MREDYELPFLVGIGGVFLAVPLVLKYKPETSAKAKAQDKMSS